ncbi:MAG: hypothetical protein H0X17_20210 [Deltaproteobacteria bacterium]|nr:hypothetical protein [Deltaproteobacteria bacterium]
MRAAVLLAGLVSSGCFYVETINQRPSLDIRSASSDPIYRGDTITLKAVIVDPEGHAVDPVWAVYACTDASSFADCDAAPFFTGTEVDAVFAVPTLRADPDGTGPAEPVAVRSLRAVLEARDEYGAAAKPTDQLVLAVLDRSPDLTLDKRSRYEFVVGTPVDLFAEYGDGDDALDALAIDWKAFSPSQVMISLEELVVPQDPTDPTHRQAGKRLTPNALGDWLIRVTVTDAQGNATMKEIPVTVVADRAPCIAAAMPQVPPADAVLPVIEPTLFQVPIVSDDLDGYPLAAIGDPILRTPTFVWSIKPPSGARQVISGATGSTTLFDPATFTPGSLVELRVEIYDRKATPITCADADPTCSVISTPCIQRQTWRVEAR